MKLNRMPTHAGVFFRKEFVELDRVYVLNPWAYMEITYEEYADFLQGRMDATAEMLLGLEEITGISFYFWRNMQGRYNEWVVSAKHTVKEYFKDGVEGDIEVYFDDTKCSQDLYEKVDLPSNFYQKRYLCIQITDGDITYISPAYTYRENAEKISLSRKGSKVVEIDI